MSEDNRALWVGNLHEKVTEELLFELFIQTGPIDRLILPADGEGDSKKHKGHAYIVFRHPESVQYATQVLEESSLFGQTLTMKARSLPSTYTNKTTPSSNKGRFDNSYRPSFTKATTWHGQNDYSSRGRGSYTNRGGGSSNYTQNNFNNYNSQDNTGFWIGGQQSAADSQVTAYSTSDNSIEEKRQRVLQQQNITLDMHRQIQQTNVVSQNYSVNSQQQQQGIWTNNSYNNTSWNMNSGSNTVYQSYSTDQYGSWFQQQ